MDGYPKPPTYQNVNDGLFFDKAKWFPRDPDHKLMSEKGYDPEEEDTNFSIYNQLDDYLKSPDVIYKNLDRAQNKYVSVSVHNMSADYFSERSVNLKAFTFKNRNEPSKDFKSLKESQFCSKVLEEEDSADVSKNILDAIYLEDQKAKENLAKQRNDIKVELKGFTVRAHQGKIRAKGQVVDKEPLDFDDHVKFKQPEKVGQMEFPSEDESTLYEEASVDKSERQMNPDEVSLFDRDDQFKKELKDYKLLGVSRDQKTKPKVERAFQKKNEDELLKDRLKHESFNADHDESMLSEEHTVNGGPIPKEAPDAKLYDNNAQFKKDLKKFQVIGQAHIDPFKSNYKFRPTTDDTVLREESSLSNRGKSIDENDSIFQKETQFKNELRHFKIKGLDKGDSLEIPAESKKMTVDTPEIISPVVRNQDDRHVNQRQKQRDTLIEETSFDKEFPDDSMHNEKQFKDELKKFQIAGMNKGTKPSDQQAHFKNPNAGRRKYMQRRVDSMTLSGMDSEVISEADANERSPNPQNSLATQQVSVDGISPDEMIDRHIKYNTDPTIPKREKRQEFPSLLTDSSSLDNKEILIPKAQDKFVNPRTNPSEKPKGGFLNEDKRRRDSEISNRDKRFDMDSVSIRQSAITEGKSFADSDLHDPQAIADHRKELKKFGLNAHENSIHVGPLLEDIEDRDSRLDMPTPSIGSLVIGEEYSRLPSEMDDSFKQRLHKDVLSKYKVLTDKAVPGQSVQKTPEVIDFKRLNKTDTESFNSAVLSEEKSDQHSEFQDSFKVAVHRDMLRKYRVAEQKATSPLKTPDRKQKPTSTQVVTNLLEISFEKKKDKTRAISNEIKRDLKNEPKQPKIDLKKDMKIEPNDPKKDLSREANNSATSTHKAVVGDNKQILSKLPLIVKQGVPAQEYHPPPPAHSESHVANAKSKDQRIEDESSFKMRNLNDSNVKGRIISPITDFIDDFLEDHKISDRKISGDSFDYNTSKKQPAVPQKSNPETISPVKATPPPPAAKPVALTSPQPQPATVSNQTPAKNNKAKWDLDKEFDQKSKAMMQGPKMNQNKNKSFHSQHSDQFYDFKPFDNEQPSLLMNSIDLGTVIPDKKGLPDHSMTQVKLLADLMGPSTKNLVANPPKQATLIPTTQKPKASTQPPEPTIVVHPEVPERDKEKYNKINKPALGKPGDDFLPSATKDDDDKKQAVRNAPLANGSDPLNKKGQGKNGEFKPLPNIYVRAFQDQMKNQKDDSEADHKGQHEDLEPEDLKTILLRKMGYKD